MSEIKNNSGFIPPTITEDNFVLGSDLALPVYPLNEKGDWTDYLPPEERQNINLETYNCTSFGTLNCFEILLRYFFGEIDNFSDRFLGTMAKTQPPGNDPNTVAQAVRHSGLIPESMLPFWGSTWQEYYSFLGGSKTECLDKGQEFLKDWVPGHEYVFKDKTDINKMREALHYSPLGISVTAWQTDSKGEYISNGDNNHWTVCYKIDDQDRIYVFDSYPPFKKVLSPQHNVQYCKRYSLINIKKNLKQQVSLLTQVLNLLKLYVSKFYKVGGEVVGAIFSKRF